MTVGEVSDVSNTPLYRRSALKCNSVPHLIFFLQIVEPQFTYDFA